MHATIRQWIGAGLVFGWALIARAGDLPVTRAVLFTSGVGFFERTGEVGGNQTIDLSFETERVPDVIKSLVVIDESGGRIQAVTCDARDPVERTLKAFRLDLSDNPAMGALLNRARGVPVRVQSGARSYEGSILGVEKRRQSVDDAEAVVEVEYLNLLTADGLRSLPLNTLQGVEVLDSAVAEDLADALAVLAGNVARDRRELRLTFEGEGKRTVRIGYLLEAPVWKTSYRLLLDEEGGFLQGWAHVENMTNEDWTNVDLSLVSGRPISFIQNLYDPIYLRRPVVTTDLAAIDPPPAYESAVSRSSLGSLQKGLPSPLREEMSDKRARPANAPALAGRMDRAGLGGGVDVAAGAGEMGELFRYPGGRITLSRRQSAMIPIVNHAVSARPVSIFTKTIHAKHPLDGAVLTNDSGLFLMRGPVTVFDGGEYAGDARLGDTARNEERLISYAVDLQSEVKVDHRREPEEIVSVRIVRGMLDVSRRLVEETVYRVRNKREVARAFILQHPFRSDWELKAPVEGVERSRNEYRIHVEIEPDTRESITVCEERVMRRTTGLAALPDNQVAFFLRQRTVSPALREALTRLAALRREQAQARAESEQLEKRGEEIAREQSRIRENMRTVSRSSESFTMWERMLVKQEKEIAEINRTLETLRDTQREKQVEIEDFIAGLNVE